MDEIHEGNDLDTPLELFSAASEGQVDIVPACFVTDGDIELLDDWAEIGFKVAECGCIVRIGGPFDPHEHMDK
jgi:hypothetical protein